MESAPAAAVPSAAALPGIPLWSFSNALVFILLLILVFVTTVFGSQAVMDIKRIKEDWPNQRCTPLVMPFAGWFGVSAKENFEFCMGKIFTGHSQPYLGSITSIFGKFTALLQMIFQSMNSMRNTVATLGGGINVIFQEFTERISMFFFRLRLSAIHLKSLFMRMYALLFSVMYMGMSGITGMTSFTNTFLFSFLDTFCFPGETPIRVIREKGEVEVLPLRDVRIGDRLYPSMDRVTACFRFYARGQPMVRLGRIQVSTNHYVYEGGKRIRAEDHSDAVPLGPWESEEPLYCLNTDTHHIPIDEYLFMDYDETPSADEETMRWVERQIQPPLPSPSSSPSPSPSPSPPHAPTEYGMAVAPETMIRLSSGETLPAEKVALGDKLSTGATVVGVIQKEVHEWVTTKAGEEVTPSTLFWSPEEERWKRFCDVPSVPTLPATALPASLLPATALPASLLPATALPATRTFCSWIVIPNSQVELASGLRLRDYLEYCSPDTEHVYTEHLQAAHAVKEEPVAK
jgi:hypothetical protein